MNKLRIGFLSTAGIGKKNWKAIYHSGNSRVAAVASREVHNSRAFIEECQREFPFATTPAAFGSYEELIDSDLVDAVYIPLPTALRKEYVLRAARSGKHVLCEKPCASSVNELEEMLTSCQQQGVQFLDGVMFMHNVRLPKIRALLTDGQTVGPIRRITSGFSFYPGEEFFKTNIRANGALEPSGCLGDLGWYSIRFALWALDWQMPERVSGRILQRSACLPSRPDAPIEFAGTLDYPGGLTVDFYCSFLAAKQQWIMVSGQNGWVLLPDFVHPFNSYEPGFQCNDKYFSVSGGTSCPPEQDLGEFGHPTAQDTRMWRHFADQIRSGKPNADWPMWALKTQQVLDACFESGRIGKQVSLD